MSRVAKIVNFSPRNPVAAPSGAGVYLVTLTLSVLHRGRSRDRAWGGSGAFVVRKQRMPVWEAKRQAVQAQLKRERSEPPHGSPPSGQVLHEAVMRARA